MDRQTQRRLRMFRRVSEFGIAMQADFTPDSVTGKLFQDLTQIIQRIESQDVTQSTERYTARQLTTGKSAAREELLDYMTAIYRGARLLGLSREFRFTRNESDLNLISRARAFGEAAAPLAADFIRHELPADFLAALATRVQALEQDLNRRDGAWSGRRSARSGVNQAATRGMEIVRSLQDLIRIKYRGNTEALDNWDNAARVAGAHRTAASGGQETEAEAKAKANG
ncbi:MAG: hypothetical protein ACKV2V_08705 [Blastocatellia bacterium]